MLASSARFLLDWLVEDGEGLLGTPLSTSSENAFVLPDGTRGALDRSSTLDLAGGGRAHPRRRLDGGLHRIEARRSKIVTIVPESMHESQ